MSMPSSRAILDVLLGDVGLGAMGGDADASGRRGRSALRQVVHGADAGQQQTW